MIASLLLPSNRVNQCAHGSVYIKGRVRGIGPHPFCQAPLFEHTTLKDKAIGMWTTDQV